MPKKRVKRFHKKLKKNFRRYGKRGYVKKVNINHFLLRDAPSPKNQEFSKKLGKQTIKKILISLFILGFLFSILYFVIIFSNKTNFLSNIQEKLFHKNFREIFDSKELFFIISGIILMFFSGFLLGFKTNFKKNQEKVKLNIQESGINCQKKFKRESLPKIYGKTGTYLDIVYELLEKKGILKLDFIANTFEITREEAVEWCNILVENGLAEIIYPTFGEPSLKKK